MYSSHGCLAVMDSALEVNIDIVLKMLGQCITWVSIFPVLNICFFAICCPHVQPNILTLGFCYSTSFKVPIPMLIRVMLGVINNRPQNMWHKHNRGLFLIHLTTYSKCSQLVGPFPPCCDSRIQSPSILWFSLLLRPHLQMNSSGGKRKMIKCTYFLNHDLKMPHITSAHIPPVNMRRKAMPGAGGKGKYSPCLGSCFQ